MRPATAPHRPRSRTCSAARRSRAARPCGCAGRRGRGGGARDWLTTLLRATNAPCAPSRRGPPPTAGGRWRTAARRARRAGPRSSRGAARGTSSEWPGNSGRWSRKASETSSSKTTCAVGLAGDDRAEARSPPLRRRPSGRRARSRGRARRGRRCSRRRPAPGTAGCRPSRSVRDRLDPRLGDAVEVIDLTMVGNAQALRQGPARRSSARRAERRGAAPPPRACRCRSPRSRRPGSAGSPK